MEIIKTPWKERLLDMASSASKSVRIASPFVKDNVCKELAGVVKGGINLELITSFKMEYLRTGSLDISALRRVIDLGGTVRNHHRLHAKIFLFDDERAVVTSSNLTYGGMVGNFEYGLLSSNIKVVSRITEDFNSLVHNKLTGTLGEINLSEAEKILAELPPALICRLRNDVAADLDDVIVMPKETAIKTMSGCKLELYLCLCELDTSEFNLAEVYKFSGRLCRLYPTNTEMKAKIRQKLQELRDDGFVEFLGRGHYRKLWREP
jgi:hypothetical protein